MSNDYDYEDYHDFDNSDSSEPEEEVLPTDDDDGLEDFNFDDDVVVSEEEH